MEVHRSGLVYKELVRWLKNDSWQSCMRSYFLRMAGEAIKERIVHRHELLMKCLGILSRRQHAPNNNTCLITFHFMVCKIHLFMHVFLITHQVDGDQDGLLSLGEFLTYTNRDIFNVKDVWNPVVDRNTEDIFSDKVCVCVCIPSTVF